MAERGGIHGLNPFEIRAGLKPTTAAAQCSAAIGLNPFEIRAGLKPGHFVACPVQIGLNPFEIRAGLKPELLRELRDMAEVLIPLKSGLV